MNRRSFLAGLLTAPAVIRTPGLLMPVKPLVAPGDWKSISTISSITLPRTGTKQFIIRLYGASGGGGTPGGVICLPPAQFGPYTAVPTRVLPA